MQQTTDAPSFSKALFFGNVYEDMIFPFPELDADQEDNLKMLLDSVRKYFTANVDSAKIDEEHKIPPEVLRGFGELGLYGLTIPEEYGGFGLPQTAYCRVMQEIAGLDPAAAVTIGGHLSIGLKALVLFGTEEQKKKYLPKLATGEWIAGFALTEPSSGSDAGSIQTTARLSADGRHYVLNGSKLWITNGGIGHAFTVFAKTDEGKISAFFVEKGWKGVSAGPEEHKLGIRGSSTTALFFEDVYVPVENLIGEQGKGFKVAMEVLNSGRLGLAAGCVGGAKTVCELATQHALNRKQFKRSISEFGMIQEKIGRMITDIYAMESIVYMTTGLIDRKVPDFSLESAICKVWCSEAVWRITNESLQIAAGTGYMKEYPYERHLRDARINLIFEGTNEILRLFIALSGIQGPGNKLKDFSNALKDPIKGFGILKDLVVPLAKPWVFADVFTKEADQLKTEAGIVEGFIRNLAITAEKLAFRHGKNIVEAEFAQKRLAEIACEIFAMVCVLSRTSTKIQKSGVDLARKEILVTRAFIRDAQRRVKSLVEQVDDNIDELLKEISKEAYEDKGYGMSLFKV